MRVCSCARQVRRCCAYVAGMVLATTCIGEEVRKEEVLERVQPEGHGVLSRLVACMGRTVPIGAESEHMSESVNGRHRPGSACGPAPPHGLCQGPQAPQEGAQAPG